MAWLFHHIPSWKIRAPPELQMPRTLVVWFPPQWKKHMQPSKWIHLPQFCGVNNKKILELPPTSFSFFWCPRWMKILKHWTQPSNFLRWKPNRTCRLTTCHFFLRCHRVQKVYTALTQHRNQLEICQVVNCLDLQRSLEHFLTNPPAYRPARPYVWWLCRSVKKNGFSNQHGCICCINIISKHLRSIFFRPPIPSSSESIFKIHTTSHDTNHQKKKGYTTHRETLKESIEKHIWKIMNKWTTYKDITQKWAPWLPQLQVALEVWALP